MKTDEEYIIKVKVQYQKRRHAGYTITIVTALIAYFTYTKSNESTHLLIDTLQVQREGDTVRTKDIINVISTNEMVHTIGIKLGFLLGAIMALIIFLASHVFVLFFGMHKERLLIKYYEQSKN